MIQCTTQFHLISQRCPDPLNPTQARRFRHRHAHNQPSWLLKVNLHLHVCSINVCCLRHVSPALRYLHMHRLSNKQERVRRPLRSVVSPGQSTVMAISCSLAIGKFQTKVVLWALSPCKMCKGNHRPGKHPYGGRAHKHTFPAAAFN